MGVAGSRCGSAGRFGIEWNSRIGLVGNAVAQVTAHQLDGPQPDDVPQRLVEMLRPGLPAGDPWEGRGDRARQRHEHQVRPHPHEQTEGGPCHSVIDL